MGDTGRDWLRQIRKRCRRRNWPESARPTGSGGLAQSQDGYRFLICLEQAYCLLMIGPWRVIYLTPLDGEPPAVGPTALRGTCGAANCRFAPDHLRWGRLRFAPDHLRWGQQRFAAPAVRPTALRARPPAVGPTALRARPPAVGPTALRAGVSLGRERGGSEERASHFDDVRMNGIRPFQRLIVLG